MRTVASKDTTEHYKMVICFSQFNDKNNAESVAELKQLSCLQKHRLHHARYDGDRSEERKVTERCGLWMM